MNNQNSSLSNLVLRTEAVITEYHKLNATYWSKEITEREQICLKLDALQNTATVNLEDIITELRKLRDKVVDLVNTELGESYE